MDERLDAVRAKVDLARRALDDCQRRLAALRRSLLDGADSTGPDVPDSGRAPLFTAPLPLEDRELHFEALDTEDPSRNER